MSREQSLYFLYNILDEDESHFVHERKDGAIDRSNNKLSLYYPQV